jgi:diguanylate cyclase (GGDEF)-like protein
VNDKKYPANDSALGKRTSGVRQSAHFAMEAQAAVEFLRGDDQAITGNERVTGSHFLPGDPNNGGFVQPERSYHSSRALPNSELLSYKSTAKRELSEEEIDQRAFYDSETKAYNLRFFLRNLSDELLRCRTFNHCASLLVVTINNFPNLGLDYGALASEAIVKAASEAVIDNCRVIDSVARFMEDRFIILCPETDVHDAAILAENIRLTFEQIAIPHQWHTIRFHANIGLAQFPGHGEDVESFVALADFAANSVEEIGGNAVLLAPDM